MKFSAIKYVHFPQSYKVYFYLQLLLLVGLTLFVGCSNPPSGEECNQIEMLEDCDAEPNCSTRSVIEVDAEAVNASESSSACSDIHEEDGAWKEEYVTEICSPGPDSSSDAPRGWGRSAPDGVWRVYITHDDPGAVNEMGLVRCSEIPESEEAVRSACEKCENGI